jgi:uncharacterized protein
MTARPTDARAITRAEDMASRVSALDWSRISQDLDMSGNTMIEGLLTPAECDALAALYQDDLVFRSRVVMA